MSKRHSFKRVALVGLLFGAFMVAVAWSLAPELTHLEALALFAVSCVVGPLVLDQHPDAVRDAIRAELELDYPDAFQGPPAPEKPNNPNSNNLHT